MVKTASCGLANAFSINAGAFLITKSEVNICPICKINEMDRQADACLKYHMIKCRKVTRPSFEILESEVAQNSYVHTGKKYGVTDNAIKKWLKWCVFHENKQLTKIKLKLKI